MRWRGRLVLMLVAIAGCGQKPTGELVQDMKSSEDIDRVAAARLLGGRDANEAIPALTAALSDPSGDVRRSAAVGLGGFGDKAKAATPELQKLLKDRDARVRDSAATALHRIDPGKFPAPKPPKGK